MNRKLQDVATIVLLICAMVVTGLLVKREFLKGSETSQGREIDDWQLLAKSGEVLGDSLAPIRIVEFGDFQCPACASAHVQLDRLRKKYPNKLAIVYRHFPLDGIHPYALQAALASQCAADQGRFEDYHAALFTQQDSIGVKNFLEFAKDVGIQDQIAFSECMESQQFMGIVKKDIADANRIGVIATPTLVVSGELYSGALSMERIERLLMDELQATS